MKISGGESGRLRSGNLGRAILCLVPLLSVGAGSARSQDDTHWWDGFVGAGLTGRVQALTVYNRDLIATGDITRAGDLPVNHIARWDGSAWHALGDGLDAEGRALGVYNGELIVGGNFETAGEVVAKRIARWNGSDWSDVGNGMGSPDDRIRWVAALTLFEGDLIAGGFITQAGTRSVHMIARWNGVNWDRIGSGMRRDDGTHPPVYALTVYDGKLVAGGRFNFCGFTSTPYIAIWDGLEWDTLGGGMGTIVYSLVEYDGDLVAGGLFVNAGGVEANHIARWDGVRWNPMGTGMNGNVYALAVYNNSLIAAGEFTEAGGVPVSNVARWDGFTWRALGSGIDNSCNALVERGGGVFVGGYFDTAGGKPSASIARWDDSQVPVVLVRFAAVRYRQASLVRWTVGPEARQAAFHVHRDVAGRPREQLTETPMTGMQSYEFADASAPPGRVDYWLQAFGAEGEVSWHGPATLDRVTTPMAAVRLVRCVPNPFNPSTTLSYVTPADGQVRLAVHDVVGRRVATLVDASLPGGEHTATWDGRRENGLPVESGTYFVRLAFGDEVRTLKLVLAK